MSYLTQSKVSYYCSCHNHVYKNVCCIIWYLHWHDTMRKKEAAVRQLVVIFANIPQTLYFSKSLLSRSSIRVAVTDIAVFPFLKYPSLIGRRGGENWSITSWIIILFWLVWQIDQVSVITCDQDTLSQNIPSIPICCWL